MQQEIPRLLKNFLVYLTTIKGKSPRTRKEYEYDISLFLRFIKSSKQNRRSKYKRYSDRSNKRSHIRGSLYVY